MINKKPEILAPCGNFEKLKFAILYGADAVYLAGKRFGMRTASDNFSDDELDEIAQEIGMEKQSRLNPVSEDDSSKSKTKSRKRTREPVEEPRDKGQTSLFNF